MRGVAVAALVVSAAYLVWRVTATVPLTDWWLSIPMLLLEVHAAVGLALLTYSLWDLDSVPPAAPVADSRHRVAVLIPTYNEPEEVLLPTIAAAVALEPAHETWVLDDGNRPAVARLAASLGAFYLTRADRRGAKAGNLNHAIELIDADLVAVLDADHVARPEFLRHTLGYFDDPDVALVQTPQDFYNAESFEHVPARRSREEQQAYSEQALFYRAIQPGKNRWQAAFWCGTGAVLRVSALRDIGGVAIDSVTEDIQTTLRLQRRGWRTVYHNEVLARGLAASTVREYALQRHRWCTGAMQVLRREHPLTGRGLTLRQRAAYAATLLGWFDAWRTLGYQLLPPAVLLTGAIPISASWQAFLTWFGITFGLQQVAMWQLGRGYNRLVPGIIFELVRMAPTLQATTSLLRRRAPHFRVTPKGRSPEGRTRLPAPRPLVALLALAVVAAGWYAATLAGMTPHAYGERWVAHGAFFWLLLNSALTVLAVRRVRAQRFAGDRRASVRFRADRSAELDGATCRLLDVSLTGARIAVGAGGPSWSANAYGKLRIRLADGIAAYPCRVRSSWFLSDGLMCLGLEFVDVSPHERARLALWAFNLPGSADAAAVREVIDSGGETVDAPVPLSA